MAIVENETRLFVDLGESRTANNAKYIYSVHFITCKLDIWATSVGSSNFVEMKHQAFVSCCLSF